MAVFLLCSTFHNNLYLPPIFSSPPNLPNPPNLPSLLSFLSHPNPPSLPNPPRKIFFYPFPLQRIYLPFRKREGKSASWRSRVCDEDLSKYNRLIIISKPEKIYYFRRIFPSFGKSMR